MFQVPVPHTSSPSPPGSICSRRPTHLDTARLANNRHAVLYWVLGVLVSRADDPASCFIPVPPGVVSPARARRGGIGRLLASVVCLFRDRRGMMSVSRLWRAGSGAFRDNGEPQSAGLEGSTPHGINA